MVNDDDDDYVRQ